MRRGVTDNWLDRVAVSNAKGDVFEASFGDLFDEMFAGHADEVRLDPSRRAAVCCHTVTAVGNGSIRCSC